MSIQITVHFDSPEQVIEGMSRLRGLVGTTSIGNPKPAPGLAKPAAGSQPATTEAQTPAPAASATKATTQAPKPSPSPAPAPAPAAEKPAEAPVDVAKLYGASGIPELIQTAQKAGRVADVKVLLGQFKAFTDGDVTKPSGKALLPAQFADFVTKLKALLEAPAEDMA